MSTCYIKLCQHYIHFYCDDDILSKTDDNVHKEHKYVYTIYIKKFVVDLILWFFNDKITKNFQFT